MTAIRKEQAFSSRETEILEAAKRVIHRHGWRSMTIDQVALDAGVAKGTVYLHFKSKDEIFARVCLERLRLLALAFQEADRGETGTEARLRAMGKAFWRFHVGQAEILEMMLYLDFQAVRQNMPEPLVEQMAQIDEALSEKALELMEEGIRSGLFKKVDPQLMLVQAWGGLIGSLQFWKNGRVGLREIKVEEEAYLDFFLDGLIGGWRA